MVGTLFLANGDRELQTFTAHFFQYIPVLIQVSSYLFQSWTQDGTGHTTLAKLKQK